MQIPILNGVYADNAANLRASYPVNLEPVAAQSGISAGYLRPALGIVQAATGQGADRGAINWKGVCYRISGTKLVRINADWGVTVIGDVGGSGTVTLDYSFDRLAIASGGKLFYYDGGTLTEVTDADLGTVLDVVWIDGYFITTDGEFLVQTELNDPAAVDPFKYGSSEIDPDPVVRVLKLRGELIAVNQNTIEFFANVGGSGFAFQRVEGAQIQKGAVGTHAACLLADAVAFVGGGRNEPPGVHLGANGGSQKISTVEIDRLLAGYTTAQLESVELESFENAGRLQLRAHLPDRTLVFDATVSKAAGEPVWFTLTSAQSGFLQYLARHPVWCFDRWIVGDPASTKVGYLTESVSTHWGQVVRWEFGTMVAYNEGAGAIVQRIELVAMTGNVLSDAQIAMQYSTDGETWSALRPITSGAVGERAKRLVWLRCGFMRQWRIHRFHGDSNAHISIARLDAQFEALVY